MESLAARIESTCVFNSRKTVYLPQWNLVVKRPSPKLPVSIGHGEDGWLDLLFHLDFLGLVGSCGVSVWESSGNGWK